MTEHSLEHDPGLTASGGPSERNPETDHRDNVTRELLAEIQALRDNGADPWKIRHLERQLDEHRLQRIDQLLAKDPHEIMLRLLEQRADCLRLLKTINQALLRPDLTVPEAIRLAGKVQGNDRLFTKTLEMEKALIQRRTPTRRGGHSAV